MRGERGIALGNNDNVFDVPEVGAAGAVVASGVVGILHCGAGVDRPARPSMLRHFDQV